MRAALVAGLIASALCGCASRAFEIRTLPPDTPTANTAEAAQDAVALAAVAAKESAQAERQSGEDALRPVMPSDVPPMDTYDPWERINRVTYRFNAHFDEAVFLPITDDYRRLPSPLRTGLHNFFDNLAEVESVINYTLQWRLGFGVRSLGRFLLNSTVGIGGLFDVATKLHLAAALTGFSTTLAVWGMHPGPYLVIPVLGPSTLRDGIGLLGDYGASYGVNVADLYRGVQSWTLGVTNAVDERAHVNFRYYATGSPFEYETVRFLYVRKRLIEDERLHKGEPPKKTRAHVPAGE